MKPFSLIRKVALVSTLWIFFMIPVISEEKPMVVIVPSYNNTRWCQKNVRSILKQNYKNFRIIYIDDHSSDNTTLLVKKTVLSWFDNDGSYLQEVAFDDLKTTNIAEATELFAEEIHKSPAFFTLIANKNRAGALANLYRAILSCADEEIIITLDGDDWFTDPLVLQRLNEAYSTDTVWLTHGCMIEYPSGKLGWSEPIPSHIIQTNSFRKFKCPSHLRTFYAWLFKKIRLEDLLYEGKFFSMTWDMAMMYPMIEMCGERHAFLTKPNYVYNMKNPINDNKVNTELQRKLDRLIRENTPYTRLESGSL